jgi:hypothetical protein
MITARVQDWSLRWKVGKMKAEMGRPGVISPLDALNFGDRKHGSGDVAWKLASRPVSDDTDESRCACH